MMRAFEVSDDRSSGHDAENCACDYIEHLEEDLITFEEFGPLERYKGREMKCAMCNHKPATSVLLAAEEVFAETRQGVTRERQEWWPS